MSRKATPDVAAQAEAVTLTPAQHPLPSEGGSYEIEAGELRQVAPPTAPETANAPRPAAPVTEA